MHSFKGRIKKLAIAGAAISLLSLAALKTIALLTKDHEYDEENKEVIRAAKAADQAVRANDMQHTYGKCHKMYSRYFKRGLDVLLSFGALILLSPAFLLCAALIYLDDPGPIFFTQKRVGLHKTHFKLHKFRSMKMCTPHDTPTHLLENPEEYITRMGRFLRKYSLDELPQIWDIFIGNMSIVGPRPALWNQYDLITERDKYGANEVRPGLTGWAQINGRDELEISEKAALDGQYLTQLRKSSCSGFKMDCKCFFGSFSSVAKADGVIEGGTGEISKQSNLNENTDKTVKKKLIAITNHSYMFWQFRRELMQELQKDYDVIICTPFVGHEEDFRELGFPMIEMEIDRRGVNLKKDLLLFFRYFKMLRKEEPDMVITYSIKPNIYAGLACRFMKIPYCVNVQGLGSAFQTKKLAMLVSFLYRASCKRAKTVFFENTGNAQVFIDRNIIPESKVTILPGAGVNLEYYQSVPYPNHDEIRFLFLGRIMKEKGIDELFYAIRRLHAEYGEKVRLDLLGFFEEEYKESVDHLVRDGIAAFHGFQSDPRPYYCEADCIVLPSYHEGMSNVLLEAAATGRCLVTSNIPGCREAVDEGVNGYLCEVKNKESLYQAMKKVMEMSAEEREEFGRRGRRKMEREFGKNVVVEKSKKAIEG